MRRRFMSERHIAYNQADYLSFEALEDGFMLSFPQNLKYSINGGAWKTLSRNTYTKAINSGDVISLQGNCEILLGGSGIGTFTFNKKCNVFGNILSIIEYKDMRASQFYSLFKESTIVDSGELILPTTITNNCYNRMFLNCTSLINAPMLPATTLLSHCYDSMFEGCTSLVNAPEFSATNVAIYCCNQMFEGCTSLVNAPELPATALSDYCYLYMFRGCTSLVNVPDLPATQLASDCYHYMFEGCTSLTTAPELPAVTLVDYCYFGMFESCTSLNYIKMLATDISALGCLNGWVSGVASSGTFVKNPDATWDETGTSGVPEGWVVKFDGEEDASLISFTIKNDWVEEEKTYQAEEGMTWAQWVESSYNTDDYILAIPEEVGERYVILSSDKMFYLVYRGARVYGDETINYNEYRLEWY